MNAGKWAAVGALCAGVGVALGAFGAHGLEERLTEAGQLENWRTGVRYQVWHGLALIAFALWQRGSKNSRGSGAAWSFSIGVLCFSGSLYALGLGVPSRYIWPVTPLGGLLLLVGWLLFGLGALRSAPDDSPS